MTSGFYHASKCLGLSWLDIQGMGGNTSFKEDGELIAIKASGKRLSELESNSIEEIFAANRTSGWDKKPSMEIGFHEYISAKYVFHTHQLNVIALSLISDICDMRDGYSKICEDTVFVLEYCEPGKALCEEIRKVVSRDIKQGIVVLGNHGLIVFSEDISKIQGLIESAANATVRLLCGLNIDYKKHYEMWVGLIEGDSTSMNEFMCNKTLWRLEALEKSVFFPDQVINDPDQLGYWKYKEVVSLVPNVITLEDEGDRLRFAPSNRAEVWDEIRVACLYLATLVLRSNCTNINVLSAVELSKLANNTDEQYRMLMR